MGTYRAVRLEGRGTVEQLVEVDLPVVEPGPGEVRVQVEACGIGATDITMRTGYYPYAPRFPFVPGYDVVGRVEAVGPGVTSPKVGERVASLLVHGGYAERVVRAASEWVPIPEGLDAAEVVALVLNYTTAYQMIHRVAQLRAGQSVLVLGASGGVGSAALELCREAGVVAFGAAAPSKRAGVEAFGATWLDSRSDVSIDRQLRQKVPRGVDAALDGLSGPYAGVCRRAVRTGGRVVWYGFSAITRGDGRSNLLGMARGAFTTFVAGRLTLRRPTFYGITKLYRRDPQSFREDFATLVALLGAGRLRPRIDARIGLSDIRDAQLRLAAGAVDGKIVLVFPPAIR